MPRNKGSDYSPFKILLARFQSSPSRFMFFSPVPTNWGPETGCRYSSASQWYGNIYFLLFETTTPAFLSDLASHLTPTDSWSGSQTLLPKPLFKGITAFPASSLFPRGREERRSGLGMRLLPSLRGLYLTESGESLNGGLSIQNRKTMF